MNKFQNVKFDSVEEFLDYLPEDEPQIVHRLRHLIALTFPKYREKLAYNVPFFYNNKRICCIWPSSVPWGNLSQGVALAFQRANAVDPERHFLKYDSRKTIGRLVIMHPDELTEEKIAAIRMLLQEAYLLDIR